MLVVVEGGERVKRNYPTREKALAIKAELEADIGERLDIGAKVM
jgi:hypothetical protein